jgi:hypothetical protein
MSKTKKIHDSTTLVQDLQTHGLRHAVKTCREAALDTLSTLVEAKRSSAGEVALAEKELALAKAKIVSTRARQEESMRALHEHEDGMKELDEVPAKLAALFDPLSEEEPARLFSKHRVFGQLPSKSKAKLVIFIFLGFSLISLQFINFPIFGLHTTLSHIRPVY